MYVYVAYCSQVAYSSSFTSQTQRYTPRKGGPDDQWRIAKYDGHVFGDVTLTSVHLYKRVWVPDLYVEW